MRKFWLHFLLLALCLMMVFYVQNTVLIDEAYYYEVYSEKLSTTQIDSIIEIQDSWGWAVGLLIPVLTLIKIALVYACLVGGLFIVNRPANQSFLFLASIKAEFVSLILPVSSIVWFLVFHTDYDPSELTNFSPFSMLVFLDPTTIEPWLKYVVNSLNLIEVLYLVCLAYNLRELFAGEFTSALKVVAMSYGIGFTIWVLFVGFIIINMTP